LSAIISFNSIPETKQYQPQMPFIQLIITVVIVVTFPSLLRAESVPPIAKMESRQLLEKYCVSCHGPDDPSANFRVDDLALEITDLTTASRWQKVLNALNSNEMPPEGEPQLEKEAKADFLDQLANVMVSARRNLSDQAGTITMRRLNRREYRATLRELLGVEMNVNELPDDTSSNFDTVGSNLFMSSTQFEQYMALGREALDEAFEWEAAAAVEYKLRFEAEETTQKVRDYISYQLDAQKRAQEWTKLVDDAVAKPENASIVEEIKSGPLGNHRHIFYRSWKKFPGVIAPEEFGFKTVENNADKAVTALSPFHLPYHRYYLEQPAIETGAYLAIPNEHPSVLDTATINFLVPFKWPVGNYVVRFQAAVTDDATPDRQFIEFGINPRVEQAMSAHEITGTIEKPQVVEFPLIMTRGNKERANRSLFLREVGTRDHWQHTNRIADAGRKDNHGIGRTFALWVDWMEVERVPTAGLPKAPGIDVLGPLVQTDYSPDPNELRENLQRFALAAFRGREPTATYIDQLVAIYHAFRQSGSKHDDALKETLSIVLASPMFLYLAEPHSAGGAAQLTQNELANRLSYFLWSGPPDQALFDLARQHELSSSTVLANQAHRLLDDPRSKEFVNGFTYQWLGLNRLDFFQVNLVNHPRFGNSVKLAARDEIYETMAHLLRNNLPITDLLKADYVVVNAILANYYGIDGVHGDEFRPVPVPADSPRGGLLGMAGVHLMGSNGDHTSPVERGVWVLRHLLNDPPPPAPANVPQLARLAGQVLTTRERVLAHQMEPQCTSCHRKIDPIGFAMENFDAAGAWRTEDSFQGVDESGKRDPKKFLKWTIDPTVTIYKGPQISSFVELRDHIATQKEAFARGFSKGLIEYALGRPYGFRDEPLLEEMLRQGKEQNYAIRSYIEVLVQSQEFQTKL